MGIYLRAKDDVERYLTEAVADGHDRALSLRALLSAVIEKSKEERDLSDLLAELQFLVDNLQPRDYSFMRP